MFGQGPLDWNKFQVCKIRYNSHCENTELVCGQYSSQHTSLCSLFPRAVLHGDDSCVPFWLKQIQNSPEGKIQELQNSDKTLSEKETKCSSQVP